MRNPGSKFVDAVRLYTRAGVGGNGLPKYGGMGGNGGDVFLVGKDTTLSKVKKMKINKRWIAGSGENSRKFKIVGDPGKDLMIPAPPGTVITTDNDTIIGEINKVNDQLLVARGGTGGCPTNNYFGQRGQVRQINLILKLIADIGFVGFPNAGKSTLLKAMSKARPKIASYPFTTITPNLGEIVFDDHRKITMADLPGLIEGAWKNYGMGHSFLKHVERTQLLLFIIDINGFCLKHDSPYRNALDTFLLLNKELELYRPELTEKPSAILLNKLDTNGAEEKLNEFLYDFQRLSDIIPNLPEEMQPKYLMKPTEIIPCSAKFNPTSVEYLKKRLRALLDIHDISEENFDKEKEHEEVKTKLIEKGVRVK